MLLTWWGVLIYAGVDPDNRHGDRIRLLLVEFVNKNAGKLQLGFANPILDSGANTSTNTSPQSP